MDKYRAWDARATDDPEFRSCASKPRQRHKSVFAGVRSVGAYVGNLAKGSGHKCAMYRARDTYGRYADGLNVANLTNWLGAKYDPDARYFRQQMQRALMRDMLDSQRRLLTSKIQAFDAFKLTFLSEDSLPEVGEVVVSVRAEHERDCSQRRQIDQLLNAESLSLDALKHAFLQVQGIASDELPRVGVSSERASTELDRRLARFLIHDLPGDFTKARGVLFDMHRRACHLQE
ncbi:MAG TPA: hypothetical protein VL424_10665 [Pararobbsia sp.]|nr:hypothetical protein [Pararobbsia sp.]